MSYTYAGQYGAEQVINTSGVPLRSTAVTVYQHGTSTPATLYTDRSKATGASNPVSTDANGNLVFFVDPGTYDLAVVGMATRETVLVSLDPSELGALTGAYAYKNHVVVAADGSGDYTTLAAAVAAQPGKEIWVSGWSNLPSGLTPAQGTRIFDKPSFGRSSQIGGGLLVTDTVNPAFTLDTGVAVEGLGIVYPNQVWTSGAPITYPATFAAKAGAQAATVKNIWAPNPFILFDFGGSGGHECFEVDHVRACPLSVGVVTDYAPDIDRFHDIDFSVAYLANWLGVSLTTLAATFGQYMWTNALAFHARRADFSKFKDIHVYGYNKGVFLDQSADGTDTPDGMAFVDVDVEACVNPIVASYGRDIEFRGGTVNASKYNSALTGSASDGLVVNQAMDSLRRIGGRTLGCDRNGATVSGPRNYVEQGHTYRLWGSDGSGTYAGINIIGRVSGGLTQVQISGALLDMGDAQSSNLIKGLTINGDSTSRVRCNLSTFRAIGNVGVQAFAGSDNYDVSHNTFENCALDTAFQGSPTNTTTTPNLHVAT